MAIILDGKTVSQKIKDELFSIYGVEDIKLTIIQVGNNPASNIYVRNKQRACDEVGLESKTIKLETEQGLYSHIKSCTSDAIMVQLPLPDGCDEHFYLNCIDVDKDADCLTDESLGRFYSSSDPDIAPCTPQGIIDLLDYYNIDVEGKRALVIGRSNIVGKPIAHLLTTRNATVTIAHSRTPKNDLLRLFATADIVISATGKVDVISEEDALQYEKDYRHDFYRSFKTNSDRVIIDVGINRDANGKLCGDFSEAFKAKYSAAYSPVPGGIGPMTVAELLKNTVKLYERKSKK